MFTPPPRCPVTGKAKFENKRVAKFVSFEKERIWGRKFRVYRCKECGGGFHLATVGLSSRGKILTPQKLTYIAQLGIKYLVAARKISLDTPLSV